MILPTKHLSEHRAIMTVGAEVLRNLNEPTTVSRLWEEMKASQGAKPSIRLSFDWFVLSLDWLYLINAIAFKEGRISKLRPTT
jgi:hypothetical protein